MCVFEGGSVGEIELSVIHITREIDVFMDYITKRKEVDNERGGGPKRHGM